MIDIEVEFAKLKEAIELLQMELKITQHQLSGSQRRLMAVYKKYPQIHYDNCSDYAREAMFKVEHGVVSYSSFDDHGNPIQTCEPPF